jgi:hypothetical protein
LLVSAGAVGCGHAEPESVPVLNDPVLNDEWYHAVTTACGLDATSFQLYQGTAPLGSTSEILWQTFDAVPPLSTSHFYNPAEANSFSSNYGAMIFSLVPQPSTLEQDLGECYGPFIEAWKASSSTDLLTFWQSWSLKNCLGSYSVGTAAIQALTNDPVTVAQSTWIEANEGLATKAYNTTITTLNSMISSGPSKSVSMASSTLADHSWSWAAGQNGDGSTSFFSGGTGGRPGNVLARFASSAIKVEATFTHLVTLAAGPLSQASSDPILMSFKPWYSSAVMQMAFANPDQNQWRAGVLPDWQSTFGDNGNMQRMCTAIVVVDGITIEITSTTTFSSDESEELQASIGGGVWPFFQSSDGGGWENSAALKTDGTITIKSTSPLGNPCILGVLVSSAADLWE